MISASMAVEEAKRNTRRTRHCAHRARPLASEVDIFMTFMVMMAHYTIDRRKKEDEHDRKRALGVVTATGVSRSKFGVLSTQN